MHIRTQHITFSAILSPICMRPRKCFAKAAQPSPHNRKIFRTALTHSPTQSVTNKRHQHDERVIGKTNTRAHSTEKNNIDKVQSQAIASTGMPTQVCGRHGVRLTMRTATCAQLRAHAGVFRRNAFDDGVSPIPRRWLLLISMRVYRRRSKQHHHKSEKYAPTKSRTRVHVRTQVWRALACFGGSNAM